MKKTINLLLILALSSTLFQCKKGEDDPFISFRSRKARVTGEWTLTSGSGTDTYSGTGYSSTNSYNYTENSYTENTTTTSGGNTFTSSNAGLYSFKLEMKKDGTFTRTEIQGTSTNIYSGVWNFTGKVGEYKNKEQVVLTYRNRQSMNGSNSSSYTWTGKDFDECYTIKELRNKKMVISHESTSTSAGGSSTAKSEITLERK